MKLNRALALAALTTALTNPAIAATPAFTVDFEHSWDYAEEIGNYYNAGTSGTGASGTNLGVEFVNFMGLSNDSNFTYYTNAPSMLGTASAYDNPFSSSDHAYMNVAAGVDSALSFYYASPEAVTGAIKAYSGLNGSGTLLGTFNLAANNNAGEYRTWTQTTFAFAGTAQSFDFTATASIAGFDNISAVPEPQGYALMLAGLGLIGAIVFRRS